ncbi:serine hydrolase domain-containing protein [Haliea sp.]
MSDITMTNLWRRIGLLLASVLLAAGPLQAAVPDVTDPAVVEAFVNGAVKPLMEREHSPSGVVAVMKDGELVFAKGYGYIDVERRIPVDAATSLFRPGSISKLFTWVAVMQLVEQGRLNLDVDVNQYLESFEVEDSWPGQPVTLRHILTHTAGFEDGALGYLIINDVERIMPLAESMKRYQPKRVNPPGEHVAYSNWATALAGLIVANVSGLEFNAYVQKHIFDVLGMERSTFVEPLPVELEAGMAKAYRREAGRYVELNYEIISNFGPAGAAAVTALDMARFARALLNDGAWEGRRILRAETLRQMLEEGFSHDPRVHGMGLGFIQYAYGYEGLEIFGHDGGTTVFASHFGMSHSEDFMLFSSFSGPGGGPTHRAFVEAFYDNFFPPAQPVVEPPADFAERAAKYAGTYNSYRSSFTKIEALMRMIGGTPVRPMDDNTLLVGDQRFVELEPNLFREVEDTGRIAFQQDEKGAVVGFVVDGFGVMQMYRAPWYESKGVVFPLLGLALLVCIGVCLRLCYQWSLYRESVADAKARWRASVAVAVSNLLFFLLAGIAISAGTQALTWELPTLLKVALVFPLLATLAGFWQLYLTVQLWRLDAGNVWYKMRFSTVTLAALFLIWFYYYWNLWGFNYFS